MSCLITLLLCGGCTYYCRVKLVAVIGDSGCVCFVSGCGLKAVSCFTVMVVVGKDHFAIGLHDVKAMVCCSCPYHCYLCPSCSPTPTAFSLIPLSLHPPLFFTCLCLLSLPLSLSLSLFLSLPLSFSSSLYISLIFSLMSDYTSYAMFRIHLPT